MWVETTRSGSPGHMRKNTYNRNLHVWRFIVTVTQ